VGWFTAWVSAAPFLIAGIQPTGVATWNLQNLLLADRYEEGRFRPDYPMPERRKRAIRGVILEARPAILFLQELGAPAFLKELQLDLAASGLEYPYQGFSIDPDSRTGLAFLSVYPPRESLFHSPVPLEGSPGHMRRGIQEVAFFIGSSIYRFFHVHLKSRYSKDPSDPEARRLRAPELKTLGRFLNAQMALRPGAALVLVGDFNTALSDPLLAPLKSSWAFVPAKDSDGGRWTYQHLKSGKREQLDGFWLPRDFPAALKPARVLPEGEAPSDHRLVLAPFNFHN
jgi:endonuclease/exonuclease/phosphatase family metal-dependent hydrolase